MNILNHLGRLFFCLLCLVCLTGLALANAIPYNPGLESEYGPEYFFAIEGDVSGQAAPGVQSVLVNGRSMVINSDLTFHTHVALRHGEKYLSIVTRYKNLNYTKKYLVIRHPKAPKVFKITIPQQEYKQLVSPPSHKIKRRLPRNKQAPLPSIPTTQKPVKQQLLLSYGFKTKEFKDDYHLKSLASAIEADDYWLATTTPKGTLTWLNELLRQPNFYDLWHAQGKPIFLSQEIQNLIRATSSYRGKSFAELTAQQRAKIIRLNRLLLEVSYPLFCPKSLEANFYAAPHESWLGFEFVAELEPGRFFIVRHIGNKYYAALYVIKEASWIPLEEISYKELVDILNNGTIPLFIKPEN